MMADEDFLNEEVREELDTAFHDVDLAYKYAVGEWDAPLLAQAIQRERARRKAAEKEKDE